MTARAMVDRPSPSLAAPPEGMIRRIPEVLGYLLHVDSFLALGVVAVLLGLLEWIGTLPFGFSGGALVLARLSWATYFFLVLRKAAAGSRRLPILSDHVDAWDTLIQPILQVAFCLLPYLILVLALAQARGGIEDFINRFRGHPFIFLGQQSTVGGLLLALGLVHLPLALLGVLCRRGLRRTMNPMLGFRLALRLPLAYTLTFTLLCALGLCGFGMDALGAMLQTALPIPLAAPVLNHLVRLWAPLAQARLLGGFVHYNRTVLIGEGEE